MIKTQEPLNILTETTYVIFYCIGQMLNSNCLGNVALCPFWVQLKEIGWVWLTGPGCQ